jgi:predicted esterase
VDAATLAADLARVSLDRRVTPDGYRLDLAVRYPDGAPRGVKLEVGARLTKSESDDPLFDVHLGEVPEGAGARELTAALPRVSGDEVDDGDWRLEATVAGHAAKFNFLPRKAVRAAIAHATRVLVDHPEESIEHLRDRLAAFVGRGDADVDAQASDARELDDLARALEEGRDPWAARTGPLRRAYRSPADGKLSEFALYVPPGYDPKRSYPLVVALHGMNGRPMEMLMWFFGHDDPNRDAYWEDRHPLRDLEHLDAIVVAPGGHFNAMYREMGEEDVMRVVDWTMTRYSVDRSRVSITGPSMGGIGTAACALRHPDRFAAAAPLCGYHSYLIRGDLGKAWMRPWEKYMAEVRSNVLWAENGQYLPMFVVHGTLDLPEENSGVLIDRYNELQYSMEDEHPELGHNVWQVTYEELKGAKWLLKHARPMHPRALRFKTPGTRWADDAWLHIRELAGTDGWGEVQARIDRDNSIHVSTRGIDAIAFDRDVEDIDDAKPVRVSIDTSKLLFQAGEPIELHRDRPGSSEWLAGPAVHAGPYKHGTVTGPLRDAFHEPLLFVWGAGDPSQARANEEAARAWAKVRGGVEVEYPVMSDEEFAARGEAIANDKALFLVGNARSNRLVRELEPRFPIRVDGDEIVVGTRRLSAGAADRSQLGVAFIRPNPARPDRYVVVVEGVGPLGTLRSMSLPDLLPDYVVYDERVASARGQLVLGSAQVRLGGAFGKEWELKDGAEGGVGGAPAAKAE